VIDDIAAAIGSFFKMLLKAIEDVIAALSVFFHFGEIIHTHKWIRDQINATARWLRMSRTRGPTVAIAVAEAADVDVEDRR
jgi:hypothetical protein